MSLLAQTSTQQLVTSSITAVTAQFQTLSTQTFNVSSINGIVPGAAFSGSTTALSSALITTSTLATNTAKTSSLTMYGTLDMTNNPLTNIYSALFAPLYTGINPNSNAGGTYTIYTSNTITYAVHSFTSIGTITFTPSVNIISAQLLVVGGGGSGGGYFLGGGGGAGGLVYATGVTITSSGGPYSIVVGNGGASVTGTNIAGNNGGSSSALGYTGSGGGGGGSDNGTPGRSGGCGGGGGYSSGAPPGNGTQGFGGGIGSNTAPGNGGGGGGGMGSAGSNFNSANTCWGGNGLMYAITGSNVGYAAGGGGGTQTSVAPSGGLANGVVIGGYGGYSPNRIATAGAPNTGSGGGGNGEVINSGGGAGGSGIVIIAYPLNQYTFTPYTVGTITGDATSNLSIQPVNNLSLVGTTQATGLLTASSFSTTFLNATTLSSATLQVSTINGAAPWQQSFLTSTVQGLGTAGYISTAQLTSTVRGIGSGFTGSTLGLSAGTIGVSTINSVYLSSVQGYISSFRADSLTVGGPTGYVTIQDLTTATISTGQIVAGAGFISSLQINTLSFGPSGYVIVGDVIANSLSTKKLNTQALYTNNAYIGNVSSQSAILFPGIDGTYKGTAVAEQTTGIGTQELLLYKVSSTTDQIRLQTTGNLVFEVGAPSRSWNSTTQLATPSLYIQGSTSNVGVGTAAPATTFDVVGTGRFQIVSSYALNVSSINGAAPGGTFNGSTLALSTAYALVSSVTANQITTTGLTVNGTETINFTGGSNPVSYGTGTDTLSLKSPLNAFGGGIASLFFGNATGAYPLARLSAVDQGTSYATSALIFQTATIATNSILSGAVSFQYTGANQSFTIPTGVTSITVYLWGAGGGHAAGSGSGGAGAYLTGNLTVVPGGTYAIIVGQAGQQGSTATTYGGGGAGNSYGSSGGGRSAIQYILPVTITGASASGSAISYTTSGAHGLYVGAIVVITNLNTAAFNITGLVASVTTNTFTITNTATGSAVIGGSGIINQELVDVGGGGGGGYQGPNEFGGYGAYIGTAGDGQTSLGLNYGKGGTQSAGGAGGAYAGGLLYGSATGYNGAGGGGGGYYAGGTGANVAAGGGGSSYTSNPLFALLSGANSPNLSTQAPATGNSSYVAGVAVGGTSSAGGPGLVVITTPNSYSLSESMRIANTGYLGIATSNPQALLHVSGMTYSIQTSTQALTVSSINGAAPWQPSFLTSTVQALTSNISSMIDPTELTSSIVGLGTIGTVSSLTAIRFFGLTGGFTNTAVAEVSTGTGTQELLLYKVSSISDQVRVQTTGNVIFESGVSARGWPVANRITTPNFYIAGSNSNVGINTSNPLTTLDVAGTGRFQTLSSLNITAGSINYSVAFV